MSDPLHTCPGPDALRRRLLAAAVCACVPAAFAQTKGFVNYATRADVRFWAAGISESRGIPFAWITNALSRARYSAVSERIMSRPRLTAGATPKNWPAHRKNFVNSQRITLGLNFMKANAASLASAFERWQVPPEIITAVIGVETIYGKSTGNVKTLDALATLSFDYTRRAAFFQNELASFLAICHKNKTDPTTVRGSFAGALGICQFMPSNIEKLGIDMDGDGKVDLTASTADAVASAANYLKSVGWDNRLPVTWPCRVSEAAARELDTGEARLTTTLQNALDAGVRAVSSCHTRSFGEPSHALQRGPKSQSLPFGKRQLCCASRLQPLFFLRAERYRISRCAHGGKNDGSLRKPKPGKELNPAGLSVSLTKDDYSSTICFTSTP